MFGPSCPLVSVVTTTSPVSASLERQIAAESANTYEFPAQEYVAFDTVPEILLYFSFAKHPVVLSLSQVFNTLKWSLTKLSKLL